MQRILIKILGFILNMLTRLFPPLGGKFIFKLFCLPFSNRVTVRQKSYLDQANIHDIQVNNEKLKLYSWGRGPKKVLFIHGWRSHSFRWRNYIEHLDHDQFTLYALDFPAHGQSEGRSWHVLKAVESIRSTIEHIGLVDSIVAHSVGCFASLYFIQRYPDLQPKQLVMLATAGRLQDFMSEMQRILGLSDQAMHQLYKHTKRFAGQPVEYYRIMNFMDHLRSKVLLIHDESDRDTDVQYSRDFHAAYPDSELHITQGLGHKLNSPEILKKVIDFLHLSVDSLVYH